MATPAQQTNPTLDRLEDQIGWYDRKSATSKRSFKWLKGVTMISAALVPMLTTLEWGRPAAAGLGIVIVVAESLQELNQFQANWMSYRSTAEALKHEKYLYLAQAGPYASVQKPLALLAERIEGVVSQEHSKWVSGQEPAKKAAQAQGN